MNGIELRLRSAAIAVAEELNFSRAAKKGVLSLRDTFSGKWSC
jgi:hypothetical protein